MVYARSRPEGSKTPWITAWAYACTHKSRSESREQGMEGWGQHK